jgi:predicted peroxiredoxin
MTSIVYQILVGTENPTRAALPFLTAAASRERGDEVEIALVGDGVVLIQDAVINSLVPVGWPPLRELFQRVVDLGIPIYV